MKQLVQFIAIASLLIIATAACKKPVHTTTTIDSISLPARINPSNSHFKQKMMKVETWHADSLHPQQVFTFNYDAQDRILDIFGLSDYHMQFQYPNDSMILRSSYNPNTGAPYLDTIYINTLGYPARIGAESRYSPHWFYNGKIPVLYTSYSGAYTDKYCDPHPESFDTSRIYYDNFGNPYDGWYTYDHNLTSQAGDATNIYDICWGSLPLYCNNLLTYRFPPGSTDTNTRYSYRFDSENRIVAATIKNVYMKANGYHITY